MPEYLELLDWRRRVSELFAALRQRSPDGTTLAWFRAEKDALFRTHPQSPIPAAERASFTGLHYWPFDSAARVTARFVPLDTEPPPIGAADIAFRRIGQLDFTLHGAVLELGAFWIVGYAGGLFVPFTDTTSGHQSYGGGRYVLDTIKSADLGSTAGDQTVVLDFNYAYQPSCAYDPRWVCPLAPRESRLAIPVRAGERYVA